MSELSQNINEQLASMPQKQQLYYNSLLAKGEEDIFGTIADIHKTELAPDLQQPAGLALAALNEMLNGEPAPRAKSELDALEHVNAEIDAAKEAGDTERANMLQGAVRKVAAAALTEEEIAAHELIGETVVDEMTDARQAQFDEAYKDATEVALRSLKRQMGSDEAEAFFKQHEEPKIKLALKRAYGV